MLTMPFHNHDSIPFQNIYLSSLYNKNSIKQKIGFNRNFFVFLSNYCAFAHLKYSQEKKKNNVKVSLFLNFVHISIFPSCIKAPMRPHRAIVGHSRP